MPKLIFESHRVQIQTPYVEPFLLALKRNIPKGSRTYEEHSRTWTVYRPYADEAIRLVHLYFSNVEEVNRVSYDDYEVQEQARRQAEQERIRAEAAARRAAHSGLQDPTTCDPNQYPYDVLYLREDAPKSIVEAAWKAESLIAHPDRYEANGLTKEQAEERQKRANVAVATIRRARGWIAK